MQQSEARGRRSVVGRWEGFVFALEDPAGADVVGDQMGYLRGRDGLAQNLVDGVAFVRAAGHGQNDAFKGDGFQFHKWDAFEGDVQLPEFIGQFGPVGGLTFAVVAGDGEVAVADVADGVVEGLAGAGAMFFNAGGEFVDVIQEGFDGAEFLEFFEPADPVAAAQCADAHDGDIHIAGGGRLFEFGDGGNIGPADAAGGADFAMDLGGNIVGIHQEGVFGRGFFLIPGAGADAAGERDDVADEFLVPGDIGLFGGVVGAATAAGGNDVAGAEVGDQDAGGPPAQMVMDVVVVGGPYFRVLGGRMLGRAEAGNVHDNGLAEFELVAEDLLQPGVTGEKIAFLLEDGMVHTAVVFHGADDFAEAVGEVRLTGELEFFGQLVVGAVVVGQFVEGFQDGMVVRGD